MINESLEKLGLRDEEVKTFVFLLENGFQTVGSLAKKTGISRPSLYGFLTKLQKLGLVIESQKNKIKIFQVSSPEKVSSIFEEKIIELSKGKSEIEKAFLEIQKGMLTMSPQFQLFEGKSGLQEVLKDMLLYRDIETKSYWPIKAMVEVLGEQFFRQLNKERIKRKLYTRAIWPESQKLDIRKHPYLGFGKDFLREIRIAPKTISFSMGYWIYGNKVAFISSEREAFGFIIESKELVEMLSTQFELMWGASKPIDGDPKIASDFLKEIR